jgi:membrane-associated phospholipid phosphatase
MMSFAGITAKGQAASGPSDPAAASGVEPLPDAPSAATPGGMRPGGDDDHVPLEQRQHRRVELRNSPQEMVHDGVKIVISPIYLRTRDLKWLVPLAGASAAAFATDTKTMTEVVSTSPSFYNPNRTVSDGLRDGMIAVPVALFGVGVMRHDEHARETGILGGEAMVDALVIDEISKLVTFRQRPLDNNGQGEFYIGKAGVDSSFVSGHAMVAWSSAAVIAGEYHSKWVQIGVYTAATGVSLTRVLGQEHFPTDVLIGSAGGWLIGHYVFRAHHHADVER